MYEISKIAFVKGIIIISGSKTGRIFSVGIIRATLARFADVGDAGYLVQDRGTGSGSQRGNQRASEHSCVILRSSVRFRFSKGYQWHVNIGSPSPEGKQYFRRS